MGRRRQCSHILTKQDSLNTHVQSLWAHPHWLRHQPMHTIVTGGWGREGAEPVAPMQWYGTDTVVLEL